HIKEVKLRVKTDEHDLLFKIRNARKFLDNGDKVKVTLSFRGREITHPELGLASLKRVIEDLKDVGTVEVFPKREGRNLMMLLTPIITKEAKKLQEKKDAKDKNK
ncbi:MAG: translation initiation factor IF-3, partial [Deltaproteobacteria bacterium]|nr:translation initiation factor IF-3 [Deltaproteobacteria bacterium]